MMAGFTRKIRNFGLLAIAGVCAMASACPSCNFISGLYDASHIVVQIHNDAYPEGLTGFYILGPGEFPGLVDANTLQKYDSVRTKDYGQRSPGSDMVFTVYDDKNVILADTRCRVTEGTDFDDAHVFVGGTLVGTGVPIITSLRCAHSGGLIDVANSFHSYPGNIRK
jgi:hypothetical protein